MLADLVARLRQSVGIVQKQSIQSVAQSLHQDPLLTVAGIKLGDDCAAIPQEDGYLLLAAEGLWPQLVEMDPWFAGWCAVMVNVSDIYAMGGQPLAIVDVMWSQSEERCRDIWQGMKAAAQAYKVPIVGGHTNTYSPFMALAVAILGQAQSLITSDAAEPGNVLAMIVDLAGTRHPLYPFWNAATTADPEVLRRKLNLLPELAGLGLCRAGKDISMGGVIGTALMLLETSGYGAILDLEAIYCPSTFTLEEWLCAFPSFGFLLSIEPGSVSSIQSRCQALELDCRVIGSVTSTRDIVLQNQHESCLFWDLTTEALTGFAPLSYANCSTNLLY